MKTTICLAFPAADCYQWFRHATKTYNNISSGLGDYIIGGPTKGSKPWIAKIIGYCGKYKFRRLFITPKWDYSKSNSRGSSGVRLWFTLDYFEIYEINQRVSSKKSQRYFCTVNSNGDLIELTEQDVEKWLKDHLE